MLRYLILLLFTFSTLFCYGVRSPYNGKTVTLLIDKWMMGDKKVSLPIRMHDKNKTIELSRFFKFPEKTRIGEFSYKLVIDGIVGDVVVKYDEKILIAKKMVGIPLEFILNDATGLEHELNISINATDEYKHGICGLAGVWIEKISQIHIENIYYEFRAGDKFIKVKYSVTGNNDNIPLNAKLSFASRGALTFGYSSITPVKCVDGKADIEQNIYKIRSIEPWNSNSKGRCRIRISLLSGTREIDDYEIFADVFNVGIEANNFKINNIKTILQGIKLPGGVPVYNENSKNEISKLKKIGFNVLVSDQMPFISDFADEIYQNNLLAISYIDPEKSDEYIRFPSQLIPIAGWYCISTDAKNVVDKIRMYDKSRFIIVKNLNDLLFFPPYSNNGFLISDLDTKDINWQSILNKTERFNKSVLVTDIAFQGNNEVLANELKSIITRLRSMYNVIGYFLSLSDSPFTNSSGDPSELYTALISNTAKLLISADFKTTVNNTDSVLPTVKIIMDLSDDDKNRKAIFTLIRVIDRPDGSNKIDKIDDFVFGVGSIRDISNLFTSVYAEIPGEYAIHYALANEKGVISHSSINFTSIIPENK